MIEQYEKEYQEAKKEYDLLKQGKLVVCHFDARIIKDRYWKAYHNLNDAKTAKNFNDREHRFW